MRRVYTNVMKLTNPRYENGTDIHLTAAQRASIRAMIEQGFAGAGWVARQKSPIKYKIELVDGDTYLVDMRQTRVDMWDRRMEDRTVFLCEVV